MSKTYTFHVNGMHCNACVVLTETELQEHPKVHKAKSNLGKLSVDIEGDFGDMAPEEIAKDLTTVLSEHSLSVEKQKHDAKWSDFKLALPIALGFIALFIFLQKIGIVNLINASDVSYGTAFVIGLIASVSTCMAVVGGLVLSMSANYAKEGDKVRPQVIFHLGRLLAFFVLGGLLGVLGSALSLGTTGVLILGVLVAVVMLILGLNLLDVFPWAKRLQPTLPAFIGKNVHGLKNINHTLTPALVGVATFFLPCGFTQSMQFYALTLNSFWQGAMLMSVFALGTLPVLALISFSSLAIHTKARSGVFFKTAGLVVLFFALMNLVTTLSAAGILPPIINF